MGVMRGKEAKAKVLSVIIPLVITIVVIGLLIISGPASAFVVNMAGFSDTTPKKGTSIASTFNVNMATNEGINVTKIQLLRDGSSVCDFNVDGSKITTCAGITIVNMSSSDATYGLYGYGFGYGSASSSSKLDYNITIDTTSYALGAYKFKLSVVTSNRGTQNSTEQQIYVIDSEDTTTIASTATATINFTNTTDTLIDLNLSSVQSGNVSVFEYSSLPSGTNSFGIPALGRYIQIVADPAIEGAMTGTKIKVYYTDAEVAAAGLDESTLRLSYYNASSGNWSTYDTPNGGVDTVNNYVWAITDHFSVWGIFGSKVAATSAVVVNSGGGATSSPNATELANGLTKTMWAGEVMKFMVGQEQHMFMLLSIRDNTATVQVSSTPQKATMAVGEEKKFDVNNDGYYDLYVKLNSVSGIQQAEFTLKTINESVTAPPVIIPAQNVTQPVSLTKKIEEKVAQVTQAAKSPTGMTTIAIVLIIILLVLWLIYKNRKHIIHHRGRGDIKYEELEEDAEHQLIRKHHTK